MHTRFHSILLGPEEHCDSRGMPWLLWDFKPNVMVCGMEALVSRRVEKGRTAADWVEEEENVIRQAHCSSQS